MKKYWKILVILLVAAILVISVVLYLKQPDPSTLRTAEDIFTDQNNNKTPGDDKISLNGVIINNVFKNAQKSSDERYLTYRISDEIEYSAGGGTEGFIIIAHGEEKDLLAVEDKFIKLLGLTNSLEACKLDVQEFLVSSDDKPSFLRDSLSFCPPKI